MHILYIIEGSASKNLVALMRYYIFITKAIRDFSEVVKINPNSSSAFFNRGCCYDAKGFVNQAISDYSSALEIDSKAKQSQA